MNSRRHIRTVEITQHQTAKGIEIVAKIMAAFLQDAVWVELEWFFNVQHYGPTRNRWS